MAEFFYFINIFCTLSHTCSGGVAMQNKNNMKQYIQVLEQDQEEEDHQIDNKSARGGVN